MIPETDSFGGRMRAARESRGLSLRALSAEIGLGVSYLSAIELGRHPSEAALEAICNELGLEFDEMAPLAGIIGKDAERYLQTHPAAVALVRKLARANVPDARVPTNGAKRRK